MSVVEREVQRDADSDEGDRDPDDPTDRGPSPTSARTVDGGAEESGVHQPTETFHLGVVERVADDEANLVRVLEALVAEALVAEALVAEALVAEATLVTEIRSRAEVGTGAEVGALAELVLGTEALRAQVGLVGALVESILERRSGSRLLADRV